MKSLRLKSLEDFTQEEIQKFDEMHRILTAYNASLGTKNELPLPSYNDKEMAEYSGYRELWLDRKCEE